MTEQNTTSETHTQQPRRGNGSELSGLVSLASLREMFYNYQAENGGLPERVHLTKQQIKELDQEAEMLGMRYETKEPESVWGVAIVESDTGPHLAG